MKKLYITFILIILAIKSLLSIGESTSEMVDVILPAENISLGRTFAGHSSGVNGCWTSPAGLADAHSFQCSASGMKWLGDINLLNANFLIPIGLESGNIGAGVGYLGSKEEDYESITGEYDSSKKLRFNNLFFSLGYGMNLWSSSAFPLGVSMKFINAEIGLDKKLLIFGDIGIIFKMELLKFYNSKEENFSMGLVLRNFEIVNYKSEGWGELRTGIKYKGISTQPLDLFLVSDVWSYSGKTIDYGAGSQIWIYRVFNLSVGFHPSGEDKITFGTGIKAKLGSWGVKVDYCLNPALSSGFDYSHWLQLTFISEME